MAYFQNFPIITYQATSTINIMERVAILNTIFKSPYTFYPYTVRDGMKARMVAERYYGDASLEWLVYLSNNIIDPYHQWPMDDATFNKFLEGKYGSVSNARNKVVTYRVNWYEDDRVLTKSDFDSLPAHEKKYWAAQFDEYNSPVKYVRKEMDYKAIFQDGEGDVTISVPVDEQMYWSPVTALDMETEENVKKTHIQLLDNKLVTTAVDNLKKLLSE
jgi:hypothetical protein